MFTEISPNVFIAGEFVDTFKAAGLTTLDAFFEFEEGENLHKANLAKHRQRVQFELAGKVFFMKRYLGTPALTQIKNWLSHHTRVSTSEYDILPCEELSRINVNTPKVVAYGFDWGPLFEQRSFVITEMIPQGESLERKLPPFCTEISSDALQRKRKFITEVADMARRFHATGFRHRDFYLAHIFLAKADALYLIDLHRTFKPLFFTKRFRIKDIAQLHYSTPGSCFSRTDRLRFYKHYAERDQLTGGDKRFIGRVAAKAEKIARHDIKHGRAVPYRS